MSTYPQLIHASGLCFRYSQKRQEDGRREYAVNNASLTVARGSVTALVGSNGSGKSTLLKLLLGQARAAKGVVEVWPRGSDSAWQAVQQATRLRGHLGRVVRLGYVAQTNSLDLKLTLAQNLDLAGRLVGMNRSERDARATALMRAFGLEALARIALNEGSGGQRRRADLARALMGRPQCLVLDEGGSGLDSEALGDLGALIRRYLQDPGEGLEAVLLVTHRAAELEWADSFVVMEHGVTSAQFARHDVDRTQAAERIVLGVSAASASPTHLQQLTEQLSRIAGSNLLAIEAGSAAAGEATQQVVCWVRTGRDFVPGLFASSVAASIVSVEWYPEDLLARVRRCAWRHEGAAAVAEVAARARPGEQP